MNSYLKLSVALRRNKQSREEEEEEHLPSMPLYIWLSFIPSRQQYVVCRSLSIISCAACRLSFACLTSCWIVGAWSIRQEPMVVNRWLSTPLMIVTATHVSEMRMKSCAYLCSCKRKAGRLSQQLSFWKQRAKRKIPVSSQRGHVNKFQYLRKPQNFLV